MTKVGVFVKNLESGGAEKQAVLLARLLTDSYDTHFIIFNGARIHQRYLDALKESGVHVHIINGSIVQRLAALSKLMQFLRLDVVFSYLTMANVLASVFGKLNGTKVVTGLRSTRLSFAKHISDCLMTNFLADVTVSNSYAGKDRFSKHGFRKKKIAVIPNCFEKIAPEINHPNSKVVEIISVGRFVPAKDYETSVKAVAEASRTYKDIRYKIIGYGILENDIRNWVEQYGIGDITEFLINPNDIPRHLNLADIYLLTSTYEGTSNSVLEAMNADLPIVATNVGDNRRMVEDGKNGYLTDVGNYENLAQHIIELCKNKTLRNEMGKQSKSLLIERFSTEVFVNEYSHLISELTK